MVKKMASLTCNNFKCGSTTAVGDVKYRVELVVDDGMTTGVFVAFDKDMVKLTNIQSDGEDSYCGAPIPKIVSDIVGKKYTFQLKLTNFNFTPHHQSCTVSCIYETTEILPGPTFVEAQAEAGKMVDLGAIGTTSCPIQQHQTSTTSAEDITTEEKTLASAELPVESSSAPKTKKQKKQK